MDQDSLKDIRVLTVDDERLIRDLVRDVLMSLGFRDITQLNSGRQAIDAVSTFSFDFIITDWRMKDLDGIDLIRYVRRSPQCRCPHVPIILLTGNTEAHYVLEARDAGVNEYMIKPFSAEQLVRRIRSIIEKPRSFVVTPTYSGPDRRRSNQPPPQGRDRRKRKPKPSGGRYG
ncbi:MAG: response regulator [Alphaproteobacteria bacterium]